MRSFPETDNEPPLQSLERCATKIFFKLKHCINSFVHNSSYNRHSYQRSPENDYKMPYNGLNQDDYLELVPRMRESIHPSSKEERRRPSTSGIC